MCDLGFGAIHILSETFNDDDDDANVLVVFSCVYRQSLLVQFTPNLQAYNCLLYTSPSPRDGLLSRMPSSA